MATHFSILAWKIPWTGEPGRLPSMWWQRDTTEHARTSQVVAAQPFLELQRAGLHSSRGAWAYCRGFSSCGTQALGVQASGSRADAQQL